MTRSSQIIPFPSRHPDKLCVSCRFPYQTDAAGHAAECCSKYSPSEGLIVSPPESGHGASIFEVSPDAIPSRASGMICDACINVLEEYKKIRRTEPSAPLTYEISFATASGEQSGYAFLCYDQQHWNSFLSDLRTDAKNRSLQPTTHPGEFDYPCMVICRGLTECSDGSIRVSIDLMPRALIHIDAGS